MENEKLYTVTFGCMDENYELYYEEIQEFIFSSFRDASEWIIFNKGLEPYFEDMLDFFIVTFEFVEENKDRYYALINEHIKFEGFE